MRRGGEWTPAMVESTGIGAAESVERISFGMTGVTRQEQAVLKARCLRRDGRKCLLSGRHDLSDNFECGVRTECIHIVPF